MSATNATMFLHVGSLLPFLLFSALFAVGFYQVAGRMGRNRWLWVLGAIIPIVNFFFWIYAWFAILLYVLDRLNEASKRTA